MSFSRKFGSKDKAPGKQAPIRTRAACKVPIQLPPSTWTADKIIIILPIPDYVLSPNGRPHWRKKHTAVQNHRSAAKVVTLNLLAGNPPPCPVAYSYAYYWPSTRRDDDNAIASGKSYMDGICSALQVDDKHVSFRSLAHHSDRKTPRLEITLHLAQP